MARIPNLPPQVQSRTGYQTDFLEIFPQVSGFTLPLPGAGRARFYLQGTRFTVLYNNAGTARYRTMDLSAAALSFGGSIGPLVNGTLTLTGLTGMTTAYCILTQLETPGAGVLGTHYKVTPGTNQFTLTAIDTAGATVTSDVSTHHYYAFLTPPQGFTHATTEP